MSDVKIPPGMPTEGLTSTSEPIMRHFRYEHLQEPLREVSEPFAELAGFILTIPRCAERTVALRKLLEAKDAAVRAKVEALDAAKG